MKNINKISVIIPVYNEEENLGNFYSELSAVIKKNGKEYEIIFVDDSSSDSSFKILEDIFNKDNRVEIVSLLGNQGQTMALAAGFRAASGDVVVAMDGDGQHNPKDIGKFLKEISQGYEVVLGTRQCLGKTPKIRTMGNRTISQLIKLFLGKCVEDPLCGFRAFTKKAYSKIWWNSSDYGVETEQIVKIIKQRIKYNLIEVESSYLDNYKGVTIIDAFRVLIKLPCWFIS